MSLALIIGVLYLALRLGRGKEVEFLGQGQHALGAQF